MFRFFAFVACAVLLAVPPATARLWKPTPLQQAQDYAVITHIKDGNARVTVSWLASTAVTAPAEKQLLDKYVMINIIHTLPSPTGGQVLWQDVEGVQVTDGGGTALKELIGEEIPPNLVGIIAQSQAGLAQATQGKGKVRWMVFDAGAVNPCTSGKLSVTYDGETYTFDTPMPGCVKS